MLVVTSVTESTVHTAADIMKEAAQWLIERDMPLWPLCELEPEKLTSHYHFENIFVGWIKDQAIASLCLVENDPVFWPQVAHDESLFVHKLSVRRSWAGLGFAHAMLNWVIGQAHQRHKRYVRLDCPACRHRLCEYYQRIGFNHVDTRDVGLFDMAYFEIDLNPDRFTQADK